jgi:retron-type reverse transcriptase
VAGVPQGSPISPLCFSLFIDDMTEVLELSKYHMYADDLQIYHSRPREILFECIREVNSDLSKVFEWSLVKGFLRLNPSKSMIQKSLIRSSSGAFHW